jgi:5-methylthioadenosine/S-adenosylhomocysteine deaminase
MRLRKLLDAGVNVALGTDGVASNNRLDLLRDYQTAAILHKGVSRDPAIVTARELFPLLTINGALAQGREDCGLLKEGFKADLIAVDVTGPNMCPADNMPNDLIFSADGKDVCLTMADGKVLYKDGEYMTLDIEKACFETNRAKQRILSCL